MYMAAFHNLIQRTDSYPLSGNLFVTVIILQFLMDSGHKLGLRRRKSFAKSFTTLCNNYKEHQHLLCMFSVGLYPGRLKFNGKIKVTRVGFGSNSNTIHFLLAFV